MNDVNIPDVVNLIGGVANYNNKHVANGKTVTLTGMTLSGAQAGNYSLTSVATTTANITQRPINVTAQTQNRIYNGTNSSSVSPVGDLPLQGTDTYTTHGTQTYDTRNVGINKVMTAIGAAISDGYGGANYMITYVTNSTGVITVKPITVSAVANTKVYDGNISALAVPTYPAFETGDSLGTAPTEVYDNQLVGTGKTLTASGLVISDGNSGNNYSISYVVNTNGVITLASTTTNLITSAASVRYMDYLTMTAQIKPLNTATPLTGTVQFKIGTVIYGSAVPVVPIPGDLEGRVQATVIPQVTNLPGGYTVEAIFTSTNLNYSGSQNSKALEVKQRNASPYSLDIGFYTGTLFAWTTGPNSSTATITLATTIKDSLAPRGDLRGAKVTFYLVNGTSKTPISSAQNLPVGLVDINDGSVGTASAIVQLNIGSANAASFQIAVGVSGAYYNEPGSSTAQSIVTISKPVPGGYMVTGGKVKNVNSSGYIKGHTNFCTDFQSDIQYTKSGTNPKGKTTVMIRSYYKTDGTLDSRLHTYIITTNAIASLNVGTPNATATFSAKANLVEQMEDLSIVAIEGGATFNMIAYQNSSSSCDQKVAITLYRKAGGIWFSSNWGGTGTVLQTLNGGQVSVAGGGICSSSSSAPTTNPVLTLNQQQTDNEVISLKASAYPNPTEKFFNINVQSNNSTDAVELKVFDLYGKQVYNTRGAANKNYRFGEGFITGMYIVEVRQGDDRKTIKLIKQ